MSTVAIYNKPQYRFFMIAVAETLKKSYGCRVLLYCNTVQEKDFYAAYADGNPFDEIVLTKSLYEDVVVPADARNDVIERARRLERKLGITINKLIVPDRHYGRGYLLGGFHHPTSRYSERSYHEILMCFCNTLEFWENEIEQRGISLIVNGPRQAAHMARVAGISYRTIAGSRFGNYHYWAWNEVYECPAFEREWAALKGEKGVSVDTPYHGHVTNRQRFRDSMTLSSTLKSAITHTARMAYWKLRGYQKARGYHFWASIRSIFRSYTENRRLDRIATVGLSDLKDGKVIYIPLHIEPEFALHGLSPEYFYQHAMIAAVSRDVPAGVTLAVKEHFGSIGRRPADFYEQIAALKNVVFLKTWESGFECARRADVVVTICGTSGLEALGAGKPVISFGRNNIYNFLPGVQVVRDEAELPGLLRAALENPPDRDEVRSSAERFLRAIRNCSFDMGNYDHYELKSFDQDIVDKATHALMAGLHPAVPGRLAS